MKNVIGERIKRLRKQCGYKTQEMLAEALRQKFDFKTDRPMISKWETGYQIPEMYTLKCLSELFNVSMDYLSGKDNENSITKIDDAVLRSIYSDSRKLKLAQWIAGLDEHELDRFEKLLDAAELLPRE